jgi:hypothetical protein
LKFRALDCKKLKFRIIFDFLLEPLDPLVSH